MHKGFVQIVGFASFINSTPENDSQARFQSEFGSLPLNLIFNISSGSHFADGKESRVHSFQFEDFQKTISFFEDIGFVREKAAEFYSELCGRFPESRRNTTAPFSDVLIRRSSKSDQKSTIVCLDSKTKTGFSRTSNQL